MDKIVSDIPINLNYDDVAETNIMAEIDCFSGYQVINENYVIKDEIISRPTLLGGIFNSLLVSLPEHSMINEEPYNNCYNKLS